MDIQAAVYVYVHMNSVTDKGIDKDIVLNGKRMAKNDNPCLIVLFNSFGGHSLNYQDI